MELTSVATSSFRSSHADSIREDDEVELQWAAIERLPTFERIRTSLFETNHKPEGKRAVDVTKLGALECHLLIEKLIKHIENGNLQLLQKVRERIDRVNVKLPTIEVRYDHLSVEAECEIVQGKPLTTLWNSLLSLLSVPIKTICCKFQEAKIRIVKDVSGIIKPSRLTLLLGPPGCGKTTFLLALAGKLNQPSKVAGDISYNGHRINEFVPQKTSAYVSQYDVHIAEMTVRETIDFSARCQGAGSRAEIMMEVSRKEKELGIFPDPDIDTYMKASSAEGQKRNLQTDYVLKTLGLDICADIMVGDTMIRGISGGQKKRLTTGEIIVGPTKALFMDEISTGLDSSTTFQIVTCLQQLVHIMDATAVIALLQPSPETFELFDDVILMAEGKILYHGPRSQALQFFKDCGFMCPDRKSAADFIQEVRKHTDKHILNYKETRTIIDPFQVISKKDQAQYWCRTDQPYSYSSVDQFCEMFKRSYLGEKLAEELSKPYDKSQCHKSALSFSIYSLSKWGLFKACMARELLLMKRNSFVYVFKTTQVIFCPGVILFLSTNPETQRITLLSHD